MIGNFGIGLILPQKLGALWWKCTWYWYYFYWRL
jgi:hypothetical protein